MPRANRTAVREMLVYAAERGWQIQGRSGQRHYRLVHESGTGLLILPTKCDGIGHLRENMLSLIRRETAKLVKPR